MKKLILSSLVILTVLPTQAAYIWTINETPDDTGTVAAPGSVVDGQSVEYFRYDASDLNNQIITGSFTDCSGSTVDYAVTLIEYNNDFTTDAMGNPIGTTPSGNDESFALYGGGQLDLFTFLYREPVGGDPANLTRGFKFDFYDAGTLGSTNTQNTTGTYSYGSPLDSNAITQLAMGENYEMTWGTGGTGSVLDPLNQIDETITAGLSQFNVDPNINNVLDANYGLFSADDVTSFEIRRQDVLNGNGRTGIRSGITLGGETVVLPAGGSIPEPSSSFLMAFASITLVGRRKR